VLGLANCSLTGRRYEETEEWARRDVDGERAVLKRLGDRERALLVGWLYKIAVQALFG